MSGDLNLMRDPASGRAPAKFILSAGWGKGLPLANDYVSRGLTGIIAQGEVYKAYGNWQGPEQSLDLNLIPTDVAPPNGISFICSSGQPLSVSLANSFAVAFPDLKVNNPDGTSSITILSGFLQSQSSPDREWMPHAPYIAHRV
jgi:hypothetical protein